MNFKVASSNPSNGGKTFVTKLVNEKTVDLGVLGTKTSKKTYYISTNKQTPVGTDVELDLSIFVVKQHPYTLEEPDENGEFPTIQLDWLHLK